MSSTLNRLHGGKAISWRTILGLLLVPVTAAGVLLWGLWNPTDRLDTVTAAVVNLDEPVTVDGQLTPLGRVLAGELVGGGSGASGGADAETGGTDAGFTWVLTDETDAAAGLDSGEYAAVVTIPENFSSAATSFARAATDPDEQPEVATIDIQTSDRGRLLDAALSNIVVNTATSVLNEQLGSGFVGGVFVGMSELGAGLDEAASGAQQLARGSSQLADGTAELATGTSELASGASQLSGGASQLASGVGELSGGAQQLAAGADGLAGGASELAAGAQQAAAGGAQLADGLDAYVGGINGIITQVTGAGSEVYAELVRIAAEIEDGTIPVPDELKQQILDGIAEIQAQLVSAGAQLTALEAGGTSLAQGQRAAANGQQELADGLTAYAGGVTQFSGGMRDFAAGVGQLSGGASQLASGTSDLASGTTQLAAGASSLSDGARQAADGTHELADGLGEAAENVPRYTDAEAELMAQTAVRPVEARGVGDELFNASGVPLFAGIALWAGAFASFLVLAPLWRRTREAARGVGWIALRSTLPATALGAAQGLIAGLVLPPLLGYSLAQGLGFLGLAVVAGISFSLVNQGLSALLGGLGRFISFALLVVAFAIGVVSTAPPLLQTIGDASPIGALFAGFQSVAMGVAGGGTAVWLLVLWGAVGVILTALAVRRARKSSPVS